MDASFTVIEVYKDNSNNSMCHITVHYSTFHTFAQELLSVRTPEPYAKVYGDFELYVSSDNEMRNQVSWFRWWNDRRQFLRRFHL